MSKVQILIRFNKEKSLEELKEEKENLRIRKLTMGDDYEPEEEPDEWSYGKGVIDMKDIEIINDLDDQHITIRLYSGKAFVIKCPFDYFVQNYIGLTGYNVALLDGEEQEEKTKTNE